MTSRRQIGSEERQFLRLPGPLGRLILERPASAEALLEDLDDDHPEAESLIPYWADPWPSAEGLIRFLASSRRPRPRGEALELGAGLGLLGLAALRLGWDLSLSEFHPQALPWLRRNLEINGFSPERALTLDWREAPPRRWRTILASDVLYERPFAGQIADFLEAALEPGGRAWIAEPGRPIADEGIALLAARFDLRLRVSRSRVESRWWPIRILEIHRA